MAKSIKPLGHRVLAKQEKTTNKTVSGLYIPDVAKEKTEIAEVIAVGSDVKDIKKGDRVLYSTYKPAIKMDGEEYLVLSTDTEDKEGDILAIISQVF